MLPTYGKLIRRLHDLFGKNAYEHIMLGMFFVQDQSTQQFVSSRRVEKSDVEDLKELGCVWFAFSFSENYFHFQKIRILKTCLV